MNVPKFHVIPRLFYVLGKIYYFKIFVYNIRVTSSHVLTLRIQLKTRYIVEPISQSIKVCFN